MIHAAPSCCANANIVAIAETLVLTYERARPRETPKTVCVGCGAITSDTGIRFDGWTMTKIRACDIVARGTQGTAATLGLPKLTSITQRAPRAVLVTTARDRIEVDLDAIRLNDKLRDELRRRIESRMRVRIEMPRPVNPSHAIGHPAILHIGLPMKMVDDQHLDPGHTRFAGHVANVLRAPIEVWRDLDGDEGGSEREIYRVIGALAINRNTVHFMHVVVEAMSHIVTTAYTVEHPGRIERYRSGVPISLRWAER